MARERRRSHPMNMGYRSIQPRAMMTARSE